MTRKQVRGSHQRHCRLARLHGHNVSAGLCARQKSGEHMCQSEMLSEEVQVQNSSRVWRICISVELSERSNKDACGE